MVRLCIAGGVVLLHGGRVDNGGRIDHRVDHTTFGAFVWGLLRGLFRGKLVDGIPLDDRPVPRVPVHLREADRHVTIGVGAGRLDDEDRLLQLLELCPELEALVVNGGHIVGGLVLLKVQLETVNVAHEGVDQLQQVGLLEEVEIDRPIPDVVKSQFLRRVGADQAAGHCGVGVPPGNTPGVVAHVSLLNLSLLTTRGLGPWRPWHRGLPTTANTMDTITLPVGGHNPVPERKICEVTHEEKSSVVVRSERLRSP
jgi:hypothetical protein